MIIKKFLSDTKQNTLYIKRVYLQIMATANKRGQNAASAAVLLALVMGLIIAFIILIPPEDRAELLDEPYTSSSSSSSSSSTVDLEEAVVKENLLEESPGRIDFLSQNEIEHPLPVVNIYTKTETKILAEKNVATAKKGVFSEERASFSFDIPDFKNSENYLLTFKVRNADGAIQLFLNGDGVYSSESVDGDSITINLPKNNILEENDLVIAASSPGIAFWATNEVTLENIKIVADVTSVKAQESKNIFLISEIEKKNMEKLTLKFKPDCIFEDVGKLDVNINDIEVYSAVPDCDLSMVPIEFSPDMVYQGENEITFRTDKGTYVLSHVLIESKLAEVEYPTYYFDLSLEQYNDVMDENKRLRLQLDFVDVVVSKYGDVVFNGHVKHFDTKEVTYTIDLSDDAVKGSNSVKLKPKKTLEVREIRVDLVS